MAKDDVIQMQGEVVENLPNATFRVKLEMDTWCWVTYPARSACTAYASVG